MSTNVTNEKPAVSRQANGAGTADDSKDVVKISIDPAESLSGYAEARAKGPVVTVSFFADDNGEDGKQDAEINAFLQRDHLFVTRYDEVLSSLVDNRFSSDAASVMTPEQREKLPPVVEEFRPLQESILFKDPPDHARLRKLIQPSFSIKMMDAMRPRIQKITDDLLDKAEREAQERGETGPDRRMDLVESFAYPMPVTVISDMLGIPVEDRPQVKEWTESLLKSNRSRAGGPDEEIRAKMRSFTDYLRDLFKAKRRQPGDDMTSQLLRAEEDGDKLNEDEVLSTVFILYLAGHVTTVNLIGNGVFALLTHPTELAKFKADLGGLAKGVVEETLRYWGPVDMISQRIAKEELELGGKRIPKGEPLMVGLAAANRDPKRFANPETYDITRPDADRHMAFGKGIHLCVGAPLARIEGQIAFETLFRRYPDMRLAVPAEEVRWSKAFLRGFGKLPVLF
ncbi:cytochrome P450 family protein [Polyangium aurulentum]|uniref:cytochrome P450 family protein n=1 Tax=Polyangium aurulentum TaxID=2567896 RepID=UPI00146F7C68|nr:cytochrome P450 [Polyangium aurulentum]UQA58087.1 cytochrome P450 [Polyangium aurulentum]